ncbi:quinone-dependent dihydroorotate dehydrogenase [Alicyclobacillaceae bacterium I2511]|nr:quinone-dependent dihydroorotate dehydrogenase [Alicyclobacillaceae bacterium I2511]
MYRLIRSLLFQLHPETAHRMTFWGLTFFPGMVRLLAPPLQVPKILAQDLWGLQFSHPIGLGAGMDKDGVAINGLLTAGFSFLEVGTVTPQPQPGNPKPRLFRLVQDEALINRMGFNNQGMEALRQNLLRRRRAGIVGINIGKNKVTPNTQAVFDYTQLVNELYLLADFFVINVSSPNTPGLRDLQTTEALLPLAEQVVRARDRQFALHQDRIRPHRPAILVKIAPDLTDDAITELSRQLLQVPIDGFVATNTTITRNFQLSSPHAGEPGGLSGHPLRQRSTDVVRLVYQATSGHVPIVASGGVFNAADAYEKICAGASLVELYTGFIYRGPRVIEEIVTGLANLLQRDGFSHIQAAVGSQSVQTSSVTHD